MGSPFGFGTQQKYRFCDHHKDIRREPTKLSTDGRLPVTGATRHEVLRILREGADAMGALFRSVSILPTMGVSSGMTRQLRRMDRLEELRGALRRVLPFEAEAYVDLVLDACPHVSCNAARLACRHGEDAIQLVVEAVRLRYWLDRLTPEDILRSLRLRRSSGGVIPLGRADWAWVDFRTGPIAV